MIKYLPSILSPILWFLVDRIPLKLVDFFDVAVHRSKVVLNYNLPVKRLTGTHLVTGRKVSVVIIGSSKTADYLVNLIFGTVKSTESLGSLYYWSLNHFFKQTISSDDMLVLCCIDTYLGEKVLGQYLRVPEFVGMRWEITHDKAISDRARRSQKKNILSVKKGGFKWETGHSIEDFEEFYQDFYSPYAKQKFKKDASIRSYWRLRNLMRQGGILWTLLEKRKVCGTLFSIRDGTFFAIATGTLLREGSAKYNGALASVYLFSLQYTRTQGISVIDLGVCLPSLQHGILLHKKRWGAALTPSARNRNSLVMYWPKRSTELTEFFNRVTPIVHHHDSLVGITGNSSEAITQWMLPGLHDIQKYTNFN